MNNEFYEYSFKTVVLDEGGYANDKDDTGKETYLGLSIVHNPDLKMWPIIHNMKVQFGDLSKKENVAKLNAALRGIPAIMDEAKRVYKQRYWDVIGLDNLNSRDLTHQIFDMAVNSGVPLATKLANELVGLPATTKYSTELVNRLKTYGLE